ncbi:MAG: universal stress protein [Magnetococcales bacterium]|nr:universal stress protein [Magnetococcales bacterium]
MRHQPNRILALIDPLPHGELLVRQCASCLRRQAPAEILWVHVCDEDIGLGFESGHFPFFTPDEWLRRTEAEQAARLHALLHKLGVGPASYRMVSGIANHRIVELAHSWNAGLILAASRDHGKITGHDGPEWLRQPQPLPCPVRFVPHGDSGSDAGKKMFGGAFFSLLNRFLTLP